MTEIEIAKAIAGYGDSGCRLTADECRICPVSKICISNHWSDRVEAAKAYLAAHSPRAGFEVGKWYRDTSGRMLEGEPHQVVGITPEGRALMDKYPNGAAYGMGDGTMNGTFIEVPAPSHEFKVGDRVITPNGPGVVRFIDKDDMPYAVEHDNFSNGHNCDGHTARRKGQWYTSNGLTPEPAERMQGYRHSMPMVTVTAMGSSETKMTITRIGFEDTSPLTSERARVYESILSRI